MVVPYLIDLLHILLSVTVTLRVQEYIVATTAVVRSAPSFSASSVGSVRHGIFWDCNCMMFDAQAVERGIVTGQLECGTIVCGRHLIALV